MQWILKKQLQGLFFMYFFGYYLLSDGPNSEDLGMISIFGVNFGQNYSIQPPRCTFIGFPPLVMQLTLNIYHQGLIKISFCGYYVLSTGPKLGEF